VPGIAADLRAPFRAAKTIAARSLSERDIDDDNVPIAKVKNKIRTSVKYFF
jgi:hypothetical protein